MEQEPKVLEDASIVTAETTSVDSRRGFHDFDIKPYQKEPLPPLPSPHSDPLRYGFLTVYRRLFSLVFLFNLIALIVVLTRRRLVLDTVTAATANLLATSLSRQPLFINLIVFTSTSLPKIAPYRLRTICAKVGHYGGLHSGSGVAALLWYIVFVGLLTRNYVTGVTKSAPVLVLAYLILALLMTIVTVAYPAFRSKKHDTFELTHRLSAWTAVALVWALLIVFANNVRKETHQTLGASLKDLAAFWIMLIVTVTLFIPWVTMRKVAVRPEYLSSHAIRLHFDYADASNGQAVSIATRPWRDWHSFICIPNLEGKGFSLVVSRAGDWTSACIANQPTQIWKRAIPTHGFARSANMFTRILIVATGSGIGPALTNLGANDSRYRVLWQTRSPLKTYGPGILGLVEKFDRDAVVIDTDKHGRQDMLIIAWHLAREMDAEIVFVITNPAATNKIVFGLEARGIPAYGPLFDS